MRALKSPPPPPKRPQSPRSPRSASPRSARSRSSNGSAKYQYDFKQEHPAEAYARTRPVSAKRWRLQGRYSSGLAPTVGQRDTVRPGSARPSAPSGKLGHRAQTYRARRFMASESSAERPASARAQLPGGAAAPPRMAQAFAWAQSPLDMLSKRHAGTAGALDLWAGSKVEEAKDSSSEGARPDGLDAWANWTEARHRSEAATLTWEIKRAEKAAKLVTDMFPRPKHASNEPAAKDRGAKSSAGKKPAGKSSKAASGKGKAAGAGAPLEKLSAKEKARRLKALESARARLAKYDERAAALRAEPPVNDTIEALSACGTRYGDTLSAAFPTSGLDFSDRQEELYWEAGLVPRYELPPPAQSDALRSAGTRRRDLLASHVRRVRSQLDGLEGGDAGREDLHISGPTAPSASPRGVADTPGGGIYSMSMSDEGNIGSEHKSEQTGANERAGTDVQGKGSTDVYLRSNATSASASASASTSARGRPSSASARAASHEVTKLVVQQYLHRRFAAGKGQHDTRARQGVAVPAVLLAESRRQFQGTHGLVGQRRPSSAMPTRTTARARASDSFGRSLGFNLGLTGATGRPSTARAALGRPSSELAGASRSRGFAPPTGGLLSESMEVREAKRRARQLGLLHFVPGVSGIRPGVDTEVGDALEQTGGFAGTGAALVPDEDVLWAMNKWKEGRRKQIVRARNDATMARAVARHVDATRRREEHLDRRRRQYLVATVARLRGVGMWSSSSGAGDIGGIAPAASVRTALVASPGARTAARSQGRRTQQERLADDEDALTRLLDGADRDVDVGSSRKYAVRSMDGDVDSMPGTGLAAGDSDASGDSDGDGDTGSIGHGSSADLRRSRVPYGTMNGETGTGSPATHRRLQVPVVIRSPNKYKQQRLSERGGYVLPRAPSGYFHFGTKVPESALSSAAPRIAPRRSGVIGRGNTGPASPDAGRGSEEVNEHAGGFSTVGPRSSADEGGEDNTKERMQRKLAWSVHDGESAEEAAEAEEATQAILAAFEKKGLEVLAPSREAIRRGLLLRGGAIELERDALAAMAVDTTDISTIAPSGPWDDLGRQEVAAAAKARGSLAVAGTTVGEHRSNPREAEGGSAYGRMAGTLSARGEGGSSMIGYSGVRWTPMDRTQLLVGGASEQSAKPTRQSAGAAGKGVSKAGKASASTGGKKPARAKAGASSKNSKKGGGKEPPAIPMAPAELPPAGLPGLMRTGGMLQAGSLIPGREIPMHPLPEMRDAVLKYKKKKKGGAKKKKGRKKK